MTALVLLLTGMGTGMGTVKAEEKIKELKV